MPTYAAVNAAEGPGGLFATLESSRLIVRCAETKTLLRNLDLDPKFVASVRHMRWLKAKEVQESENQVQRLLLATNEDVHVYDIRNPRWQATIKKACGEGGKIASVDFGAHEGEIIAFSAFGLKACIWPLDTGAATEVRDPKIPSSRAHSLRANSGHLAILTRSAAKDVLTVISPDRKEVEYCFHVPTVDAQGVKWSPDGRWLVIWDTAAAGTGIVVYTATGQLFKKFSGGDEDLGYGVQRVDWSADSKQLIILMNDAKAVFMSARIFQPAMSLEYPSKVVSHHAPVQEEEIKDGVRTYMLASHPIVPPTIEALGFNFAAISPSQNLFACVLAKLPTTVWIHALRPNPQLTTVLVHHGAVKHLSWHPAELLLMHCSAARPGQTDAASPSPNPNVYIWGYDLAEPTIVPVPAAMSSPITKAAWLGTIEPRVVVSTATSCSTISVLAGESEDEGEFPTPKPVSKSQRFSVEATPTQMLGYAMETPMSSATSNFSPIKMDTAQLTKTLGFQFTSLSETDDTFDFKRPMKLGA